MLNIVAEAKCFNGLQRVYQHFSKELGCDMKFSLYLPEAGVKKVSNCHVLFYLSGLGCSEQTIVEHAGAGFERLAAEYNMILVGPDTSPRGCHIPDVKGDHEIGQGAGAYINALKEPWSSNYRMFSYITEELPSLIKEEFEVVGKFGIMGHSMGGHGAVLCGLKAPSVFSSISAFSPICNPTKNSLGIKWFFHYLGEERQHVWDEHDSCRLIEKYNGSKRDILVDQGLSDKFLSDFLHPDKLKISAAKNKSCIHLSLRLHPGFNHSYYFIATFLRDHFEHHKKILNS